MSVQVADLELHSLQRLQVRRQELHAPDVELQEQRGERQVRFLCLHSRFLSRHSLFQLLGELRFTSGKGIAAAPGKHCLDRLDKAGQKKTKKR